jgi:hypothetical protein
MKSDLPICHNGWLSLCIGMLGGAFLVRQEFSQEIAMTKTFRVVGLAAALAMGAAFAASAQPSNSGASAATPTPGQGSTMNNPTTNSGMAGLNGSVAANSGYQTSQGTAPSSQGPGFDAQTTSPTSTPAGANGGSGTGGSGSGAGGAGGSGR